MKLENNIKYLIIARKEYQKVLYSLKEKNPTLDFNIVSPSLFYNLASFKVKEDAISFLLLKEKYDFNNTRNILSIINKADLSKNKELNDIYLELEKNGYIEKDELFNIELKRKQVIVFEEKENSELYSFLKRNNFNYSRLSFEDLEIKENKEYIPLIFDNKLNQFFYIFSSIRNKIINEKVDPNDISILSSDENDIFYLKYCSDIFNIDVDIVSYTSLRNNSEINEFISKSFETKYFDINSIKNDTLKSIFEMYHLDRLKDFDFALLNLYEILSTFKIKNELSTGIKVTSSFDISSEIVYITNFQYDVFYKVYQDSGYFSDDQLSIIGLNPSYTKTLIDKELKSNYLKYSKIEILSRCLSSNSEKIYPSQFVEEWNKKFIPARYNDKGLYTSKAIKIIQSIDKDLHAYKEDEEYKSYSNKYQKISTSVLNSKDKVQSFNPSLLKEYYTCPFSFYLSRILLSNDEIFTSNENTLLGELLHSIFENNYQDISGLIEEVDFETIFKKAFYNLKNKYKDIDPKMEQTLLLSKDHIKAFYLASLKHKFNNRKILPEEKSNIEQEINVVKKVNGKEYLLKGRVDKVLNVESTDKKYYVIIDYKSSTHDSFDYQLVPFGGSLQLPFYYVGLYEVYKKKGYDFGGFFIHNIFNKHCIKPDDNTPKLDNYFYRLSGLYLQDIDFVNVFDNLMISNGKIRGQNKDNSVNCRNYFTSKEGTNQINKHVDYSFDKLIEDAEKTITSTATSIYSNDFEIAPKIKNQKVSPACSYCSYKDICYRRHSDINNLEEKINAIFGESEDSFDEENE